MSRVQVTLLLGDITSALASANADRVFFEERLHSFKHQMLTQRVPHFVQRHMVRYYSYLWTYNKGVEPKSLFVDLPIPMRAEIAVAVTRPMWSKIPFLRDLTASFIRAAALRVNNLLFTPGQICTRAGDLANELYYIKYGEVEVVRELLGEAGAMSHDVLMRSGQVFAYREMLTNATHEKTTRARGHVELLALSNSDLMEVLRDFPDVYTHVHQHAHDKYNYNIDQPTTTTWAA